MLPGLVTRKVEPLSGKDVAANETFPPSYHPGLAYLRLLAIFAGTKLFTSVLMVSVFTSWLVPTIPLRAKLAETLVIQAWHVPVYALLSLLVLQGLAHTDLYRRLLRARR